MQGWGEAEFSNTSYERQPFLTADSQRSDIFRVHQSRERGGRRRDFYDQGWSPAAVLICTTTLRASKGKTEPLLFKGKDFLFLSLFLLCQLLFSDQKALNADVKKPSKANQEYVCFIDAWTIAEIIYRLLPAST